MTRLSRAPLAASLKLLAAVSAFAFGAYAQAADLPVGVELPLTGGMARAGTAQLEGIRIAADMFNQRDPKHTVKLTVIDDEAQPAKAVSAVEKLASQGVLAITGGYGSNSVSPASEAADKAGLVYITSGAVDSGMTSRGLKNFFRVGPSSGYAKTMIGVLTDMNVKSVSIVSSTKQAPTDLSKDVSSALTAKGVKVTVHEFDPSMTDFKPIVNKIKLQDKPDVMVMMGYENDYIGILRAAKVLKPPVKAVIGSWALVTPKMAAEFPELVNNVVGNAMLPHPVQFASPEGKAFVAAYQKAYNKDPDYLAEFSYVQSMVLFDALAKASDKGTLKSGGVASELRARPFDTLIGTVHFDNRGENPAFLNSMAQIQDGKVVVIWPKEKATGKLNYPAQPW
ncbi:branched-chain amino acid ABC transporter substrate-binding protein [Burkholderia sp. SRS-W-2-2016]|uniref:ABC transporter substrate-binding protein n=1 Tax=Burkholderia sp. SRS-W-2-2016 TaxID=1926878 RepID=UPI00094AA160|nr:ABC transporter substrate-binding protein [Burkholderia sp. SRS-W-2-2016]OLL32669.1 branched-chain amino acid ABC transporter substrate-binding protein [Burkholderia sp. SRS-W-2-2016]